MTTRRMRHFGADPANRADWHQNIAPVASVVIFADLFQLVDMRPKNPSQSPSRSSVIDVAKHAGVSIATVSRVLNGTASVRPEKAEAVRRACEALDYVVNGSARALSSKRTWTVGVVVPTFETQTFSRLVAAFQKRLHTDGYSMLLASSGFDVDLELKEVQNLTTHGIDALMIVGHTHHEKLWEVIERSDIPYVQALTIDKKRPSIGYDNVAVGYAIADHLITLGHRHIGVIVGTPPSNDRVADRIVGLQERLAKSKRRLHEAAIARQAFTLDDAIQAAHMLLSMTPRPTALVCGNDMLAFGVMLAATELGIAVPHALSVVGFNNYDFASRLSPPLTTVDVDLPGMGKAAAEYLLKRLQGLRATANHRIKAALLVRSSTQRVR